MVTILSSSLKFFIFSKFRDKKTKLSVTWCLNYSSKKYECINDGQMNVSCVACFFIHFLQYILSCYLMKIDIGKEVAAAFGFTKKIKKKSFIWISRAYVRNRIVLVSSRAKMFFNKDVALYNKSKTKTTIKKLFLVFYKR